MKKNLTLAISVFCFNNAISISAQSLLTQQQSCNAYCQQAGISNYRNSFASLTYSTASNSTSLLEVARRNDVNAMQYILTHNPQRVNERGKHNMTALHIANSLPLPKQLVRARAKLDARDVFGATPLMYAVRTNNIQKAMLLLDLGVEVDAPNKYGETSLSFAKSRDMAELLISFNAQLNGGGFSAPLHAAAFYGWADVAQLLIESGANIDQRDLNGDTPLHRAAFKQNLEVMKRLLLAGARANLLNNNGRRKTPFDMTSNAQIKQLLASYGGHSAELATEQ